MAVIKDLLHGVVNEESIGYILQHYPTMQLLSNLTEPELMAIPGITRAKAKGLVTAFRLGRACYDDDSGDALYIKSPQDAYKYCRHMGLLEEEHFVVLPMTTKNRIIAHFEVSRGSLNSTIVHPREVFAHAVRVKAASIICVHNHPSGLPEPSREDVDVSGRLKDAGRIIGIELMDHVVIGGSNYVSLKERGLM